jgi:hypothetical protein
MQPSNTPRVSSFHLGHRALFERIFYEGNIAAPRLLLTEGIVAAQYLPEA